MPEAIYNESGLDGLPFICPATFFPLARSSVRTTGGGMAWRRKEYFFAGVNGAAAQNFGRDPTEIRWDFTVEANNAQQLVAFNSLLAQYGPGKRYELVSEWGLPWVDVELVTSEITELYGLQNGRVLAVYKIVWRWMKPGN